MKSYKQLAEETREKIIEKQDSGILKDWDCLIDSWLSFMERDWETPEAIKAEQYRDMTERLERELEKAPPRRHLSFTFCYISARQRLEPLGEEKEARMYHIAP